jgi:hypothetical protein
VGGFEGSVSEATEVGEALIVRDDEKDVGSAEERMTWTKEKSEEEGETAHAGQRSRSLRMGKPELRTNFALAPAEAARIPGNSRNLPRSATEKLCRCGAGSLVILRLERSGGSGAEGFGGLPESL